MRRETLKIRWFELGSAVIALLLPELLYGHAAPRPLQSTEQVEEINTEFHFLGLEDALLIHEEEGLLKGQINVAQGEEESDSVISYPITIGNRTGNHLEIKTGTIHRKYYRFNGKVERGSGHKSKDGDYLRLVGDVQIVTVQGDTGKEDVVTKHVVMKSLSASEIAEEGD